MGEVWQAGDDRLVTTNSEVLLVVAKCIHPFSEEENPSVSKEASSSETVTPKEQGFFDVYRCSLG